METAGTREHLADLGCDLGQGFLHGRPMPAADLARWLARRGGRVSATRSAPPDEG